jgi:DNA-binding NarL/FixJ family response regulator
VAEADPITARLLAADLRRQRQFHVIECALQVSSILDCIAENSPDVLLVGASLLEGALAGLASLKRIRTEYPRTRGIVFVESLEPRLVAELFRAGAKGIFDRSDYDVKRLCRCIRCVAAGQVWANSEQIGFVLDAFVETAALHIVTAEGEDLLTKRETDVVRLVAEGFGNRDVAQQLGLSEHTVKNYLFNVFGKLGISSRTELVMYALSNSDNRLLRADESEPPQSTLSIRPDARENEKLSHSKRAVASDNQNSPLGDKRIIRAS